MIIAASTQKGGTGKTTTAAILAQAAAIKGIPVLAVDMDPQANLTFALGATAGPPGSRAFLDGSPAGPIIQHTAQDIDVIPASWDLAALTTGKGSARRLQAALEPLKGAYRLIVIDTPSTAGELQYNALQAAEGLIIPVLADAYGIQALYQVSDTARKIRQSNPGLKILGTVITAYRSQSNLARQMADAIEKTGQDLGIPFLGSVRAAVAVQEAAALRESLFTYAPKSKPAADYKAIFDKLAL